MTLTGVTVLETEQIDDRKFADSVLRMRAHALIDEFLQLRRRPSYKAVHDTRVQSRRMRAALEAFEDTVPSASFRKTYEAIRDITQLLGKPRETGVNFRLLSDSPDETLIDTAQKVAREYLLERLDTKLNKQQKQLGRKLGRIDPSRLRSRLNSLVSPAGSENPLKSLRSRNDNRGTTLSGQTAALSVNQDVRERAHRILRSLSEPLSNCPLRYKFAPATEKQLHLLRIATKELRYAMELFDPVWPEGLHCHIETARALQDATGHYHDWCVLYRYLKREVRRVNNAKLLHLAEQIGRLLTYADEQKRALKMRILPALVSLQKTLHSLSLDDETPHHGSRLRRIDGGKSRTAAR